MTTADRHAALLFAIGPVQDFIATARKGQDFWFGSWLLSELSREAASVAENQGAELVLPAPTSLKRRDAVANKIVARVRAMDAERVATAMEGGVRKRLDSLAKEVFEQIQKTSEGRFLRRDSAEAQVADLPEIYWVAVNEVANWGETRRRAEAALAARKSLRDFGPVPWGAPVPKSQLDGGRESVIDEAAFPRPSQQGRAEPLRKSFGIGPNERLCGVGLLKRNGRRALPQDDARGSRVISTAHVASWSLRRAWADTAHLHVDLKRAFGDFVAALPDEGAVLSKVPPDHADPVLGRIDGLVLFAGRLSDFYEGDNLSVARTALRDFLETARNAVEASGTHWPVLSPYYAVLRADGDQMGAWLDDLSLREEHQKASEVLGAFAAAAEVTVRKHHGHCIFAGGDDVLALLPVATALDCAKALNLEFAQAIEKGPRGPGGMPTLSAGIQLAHATVPFRDTLDGARKAEYAAKHTYGRAAFAIQLHTRSGAPTLVGGKWEEFDSFRELQRLQEAGANAIPRGLAYGLREVADRLRGDASGLASIRALEVDRVIRQKELNEIASQAIRVRLGVRELDGDGVPRVCEELIVARALAALEGEAP